MSRQAPSNTPNTSNNARNEYIPSFISQKPFYVDSSDADYLEHQRLQSISTDTLDKAKWYERGRKVGPAATKFRKGACENCGAMTHKTKDCLSRPRKHGAKWTGQDIQADEVIDKVSLGWDAKRDRWNGYDNREYQAVVEQYEDLEALVHASKRRKVDPSATNGTSVDANGSAAPQQTPSGTSTPTQQEQEPPSDDLRYGEETDMGRSQAKSTRQLRLREDTAGYLKDLNLDSAAKYDPKTRTLDTSTSRLANDGSDPTIADEGFTRKAATEGDAVEFERAQRYAWQSQETSGASTGGTKLHLQANPTHGEIVRKKLTAEADAKRAAKRKELLDKYGAQEDDGKNKKSVTTSISSSVYVEYDPETGMPIPAPSSTTGSLLVTDGSQAPASIPLSKYPEDIHPGNHSSVFGSWYDVKQQAWGYQCCHATTKNAYCVGEEGKRLLREAEVEREGIFQ